MGGSAGDWVWCGGDGGWEVAAGVCAGEEPGRGGGPCCDEGGADDRCAREPAGGVDSAGRPGGVCIVHWRGEGGGDRSEELGRSAGDRCGAGRGWIGVGEVGRT